MASEPKITMDEVRETISVMRTRVQAGGQLMDAKCRLSLRMSEFLLQQRDDWRKGALAYRDEMFRQGRIEKFKQDTIRKLTGEEHNFVMMVASARNETVELLQENNQLKAEIERLKKPRRRRKK